MPEVRLPTRTLKKEILQDTDSAAHCQLGRSSEQTFTLTLFVLQIAKCSAMLLHQAVQLRVQHGNGIK